MFRSNVKTRAPMRRAMAKAIESGDLNTVRKLITRKTGDAAFLNAVDQYGNTALLKSIRYGKVDIAAYLLSCPGIDVNQEAWEDKFEPGKQYRCAPLNLAIKKGYIDLVKTMLMMPNTNVNNFSFMAETALDTAVIYQRREIINLLLRDPRLNLSWLDELKNNIFTWVYHHLSRSSFIRFITHPDVTIITYQSMASEFFLSQDISHDLQASLLFLLTLPDFDVNSRLWEGVSLLMLAAKNGFDLLLSTLMARDDINPYLQDDHGFTAVLWAAKHDHMDIVKMFLNDPNFNWDAKYRDGKNLLMLAAEHELGALTEAILTYHKLDVNARDDADRTALMLAAMYHDNTAIVTSLLSHGADITLTTKAGRSAYREAKQAGHLNVKVLLKPGKIDVEEYRRFTIWKQQNPDAYKDLKPEPFAPQISVRV